MTTNIADLNRAMENALRSLNFEDTSTNTTAAANKISAAASTTLLTAGETKSGQETLTSDLGALGAALLDAGTPVLSQLVEAMPDSSSSDLSSISGVSTSNLSNSFTHVVAGSPSTEGVKAQLESAASKVNNTISNSDLRSAMEEVAESEFVDDVAEVAEKVYDELADTVTTVGTEFVRIFDDVLAGGTTLAGDVAAGLSAGASEPFSSSSTQNMINTLDASQPVAFAQLGLSGNNAIEVTELLFDNRIDLATDRAQAIPGNNNLSEAEIQTRLSNIPIRISEQITPPISTKNVTTSVSATTEPFNPTAASEKGPVVGEVTSVRDNFLQSSERSQLTSWTTDNGRSSSTPASSPSPDIENTIISGSSPGRRIRSYQELNLSMKGIKREVTEMVIYQRFANANPLSYWDFDAEMKYHETLFRQRGGSFLQEIGKPTMHIYVDMQGNMFAGSPFQRGIEFGIRDRQDLTIKVMFFSLLFGRTDEALSHFVKRAKDDNIGFTPQQSSTLKSIVKSYHETFPYGRLFYADVESEDGYPESNSITNLGSSTVSSIARSYNIQNYGTSTKVLTKSELQAAAVAAAGG